MARFQVAHDYAATVDGRPLMHKRGDVIELDITRAAAMLRDSPGVLRALGPGELPGGDR